MRMRLSHPLFTGAKNYCLIFSYMLEYGCFIGGYELVPDKMANSRNLVRFLF